MKKVFILRRKEEIGFVLRKGRRFETLSFVVFSRESPSTHSRFVFIVSQKVAARSTVRNRLRRRVREWVRTHAEHVLVPLDIAFIFKKEAAAVSRHTLYAELEKIMRLLSAR